MVGIIMGLLIYSGVGAAYPEVPGYYLFFYFGFLIAFVVAFKFFIILFRGLSRHAGLKLPDMFANIEQYFIWKIIIFFYILLHIIPLIYPEFRLDQLLNPPTPDLASNFAKNFEQQEVNYFLKLIKYANLLLTPFFFVAVYRYKNNIYLIILLLSIILYITYVDNVYAGRGALVMNLGLIWVVLWMNYPQRRLKLVSISAMLLPMLMVAFYIYGIVRTGRTVDEFIIIDAIQSIIYSETTFPVVSGMPLIESGVQVNLGEYLIWIATLPIPKIVTGEIAGARITYEISEIVLGGNRGDRGWFVILPGIVAESVYIFGKYFFWLHGVTLAFIAALVVRLIERTPQFLVLNAYLAVILAYPTNRAGISSLLPVIVNNFIVFYVVIFILLLRRRSYRI